jgi:uncharacterized protein YjdB
MSRRHVLNAAALAIALVAIACEPVQAPEGPKTVATVAVTSPAATLQVGQQITLTATPKAADGEVLDREVAWSSQFTQVATVSSAGVVTGVAPGLARIIATSEGQSGNMLLTIQVVPVADVRLSFDEELQLEWDGSAQVSAVALDANGAELPGRAVQWLTSKPSVVTVSPTGLLQAVSAGTAMITAIIEGVASTGHVRVHLAPVVEVGIDAVTGLEIGETVMYTAAIRRASGQIEYSPVSWSSSATGIVQVEPNGATAFVEALAEGTATITASAEGKSASVTVRTAPKPTHDLIYSRWRDDRWEIFTLSLAAPGAAPLRLNAGTVSRDPSPSPDGTQFVFFVVQRTPIGEWQHDLYIVKRDGTNMRWLTRTVGSAEDEPAWSPDGTQILFRGGTVMRTDLWVINVDGTGAKNLTADLPAYSIRNPAWSPDGKRIAFVAAQDMKHNIWTMNADGTDPVRLTWDDGVSQTPTWSPEGDRIAYTKHNSAAPQYGWDVMIMSAAGGVPVRLELRGDQLNPAWSPDGRYIAVQGTEVAGQGPHQLYTMRPDGTGLRLRTYIDAWGGGVMPAWITRP